MSRGDPADRGDGFLGRWIKRKAESREQPENEDERSEGSETEGGVQSPEARPNAARAEEPAFDLSKLPTLDDIRADTNLSDFMRREVPAALRNAALKKAWALDPVIRDYVNPAREYAYDWNVPGGVPGSGPLEAGFDALKEVVNALGSPKVDHTFGLSEATEEVPEASVAAVSQSPEPPSPLRLSDESDRQITAEVTEIDASSQDATESAPQQKTVDADRIAPRRRHGGAAPA